MHLLRNGRAGHGPSLLLGALCVLLSPICACALEPVSLQLKWTHHFQFAGYYAALEKGFYEDEGLGVTLLEGGSRKQGPVRAVTQGKATYGVAGSELLMWRLNGMPVVALAPVFQHSATVILVRRDSGISSPQDFAGRRLEMGEKANDAEVWAMIRAEGLNPGQFTRVQNDFSIEDLIAKRVDGLSTYDTTDPFVMRQKKIPYRVIRPLQYGIDFYGDTLFTTEAEVRKHPDRARRMVRASMKGWRYAFEHPDEIIDLILGTYVKGADSPSREHLVYEFEKMKQLVLPRLVELGHMNEGRWNHMAETLVQIGLADPGYDLSGFFYKAAVPIPFDWDHWAVRGGGAALILAVSVGVCLCFYNRRMRAEICRRIQSEEEREQLITELTQALEEVRELNGLLPICSSCFKVRNDKGYWEKLESYIESHTKARFSHGICTECMKQRYPYLFDEEEEADGDADALYNEESGTLPPSS